MTDPLIYTFFVLISLQTSMATPLLKVLPVRPSPQTMNAVNWLGAMLKEHQKLGIVGGMTSIRDVNLTGIYQRKFIISYEQVDHFVTTNKFGKQVQVSGNLRATNQYHVSNGNQILERTVLIIDDILPETAGQYIKQLHSTPFNVVGGLGIRVVIYRGAELEGVYDVFPSINASKPGPFSPINTHCNFTHLRFVQTKLDPNFSGDGEHLGHIVFTQVDTTNHLVHHVVYSLRRDPSIGKVYGVQEVVLVGNISPYIKQPITITD